MVVTILSQLLFNSIFTDIVPICKRSEPRYENDHMGVTLALRQLLLLVAIEKRATQLKNKPAVNFYSTAYVIFCSQISTSRLMCTYASSCLGCAPHVPLASTQQYRRGGWGDGDDDMVADSLHTRTQALRTRARAQLPWEPVFRGNTVLSLTSLVST